MRKLFLTFVLALIAGATALPADVQGEAVLRHIRFLAADDMKGRANGSQELERAATYVAEQFKAAGLQPAVNDGWYQPFSLVAGLQVGKPNQLTIASGKRRVTLQLGTTYYPLGAPTNDDPAATSARLDEVPLVFAGYGLQVPSLGYDDYADIDVNGKAVVIFSHEPQERDPKSKFNGARPVPESFLEAKAKAAMSRGARALIVISDPSHVTDDANYRLFGLDPDTEETGIPVLRVRRTEMGPLVFEWQLDSVAARIDADLMPRSRALSDATVTYVEHLAKNRKTVRNVIGILPGSDPARAAEAVVIGAHYDHVGIGGRLSVSPDRTGEIHNGADDNASGTAAIIEMARAAAADRGRFARTLVFIAFAGEERGLLGSAHYAAMPVIPIERTVAMLNLDMVGRANGSVDVSGLELSPSMEANLKAAQQASGNSLRVQRQGPGAGRSDDSSFIAKRIPAINFFTGFHGDYHRPGDDWDKVDEDGTARVARLALELAAQLAARPDRPEFVEK